ncbi:hypothetical protein [Sphingobacterium pedocola]|uniref:Uncharacterized protein n=1 Tax=Sphingobacterium pedocola TaxID=2082722 RepID=A0ABR9T4Y8_9SPHI|nr:hypothetical protein [Sphingobacterium pedocola]MBE8719964.1 hypothetical protein [Sphingobacterium pedocola]
MRNIYIQKIVLFLLFVASISVMNACKTEYEQILKPFNSIEQFSISGYGDIDSLDAVINNNQITVYWSPDAERPAKITPHIKVSEGASISPASGEEVDFSENTTYTVTAEDGSISVFNLKPVFNIAVPSIYNAPTFYSWSSPTPININGQYFLSTGDVKDIKVYLQRVSDGFEFDVPFDESTATTNLLQATLPALTSELDTGIHRLYVKVGDFKSSVININLLLPTLTSIINDVTYSNYGNVPIGSDLEFKINVKEGWQAVFNRYYSISDIASFGLGLQQIIPGQVINGLSVTIDKNLVSISEIGNIVVKVAPDFFNTYKHYRIFNFSLRHSNSSYSYTIGSPLSTALFQPIIEATRYATLEFSHEGKQIKAGEEMTLDYTFDDSAIGSAYTTFAALALGLKDASTGVYSTYNIPPANRAISGNRITFTIPTTATAVLNKEVVIIGLTFRGTPINNTILPRKKLTNTHITN